MDRKYVDENAHFNPYEEEQPKKVELTIKELVRRSHELSVQNGFWEGDYHNFAEKLCLIHSEISEALEDFRAKKGVDEIWHDEKGAPKGVPTELADAMIRIADLCGYYNIDLESVLNLKHNYNKSRPYKHGKAF